jgi:hypothetical protein
MRRPARVFALALALVALMAGIALARPGGGQSFSGGGGHYSGGGSSGGGGGGAIFELVFWMLRLIFIYPAIGVPMLIGIIVLFAWSAHQRARNRDWDSGPPVETHAAVEASDLASLRGLDPDFSHVLFEDFAFRLFSTAQRARDSANKLETVSPYVSETARTELAQRDPVGVAVEQVIVGAQRVVRVDTPPQASDTEGKPQRERIAVEYEANCLTPQATYYSVETWLFARDATRTTKPPGGSRDFPCPNCGQPWQSSQTGTQVCASCGQVVDNGRFDWFVEQVSVESNEARGPTLTANVEERGNDLPTYFARDVNARWQEVAASDPAVTKPALEARLKLIYDQLNKAWSANQLTPVRGFVSDGLFDYLTYWTDAYKRQGLRNVLVDMHITASVVAKVERDRWYDSVTIRLWGTGKDFTVQSATGKVLSGSKLRERAYTEYWTLIRSAARKGAPRADANCSNCGAPLHVTMAGACEHCGAHVTAGEFDWVLSKIEQDDTYRG